MFADMAGNETDANVTEAAAGGAGAPKVDPLHVTSYTVIGELNKKHCQFLKVHSKPHRNFLVELNWLIHENRTIGS